MLETFINVYYRFLVLSYVGRHFEGKIIKLAFMNFIWVRLIGLGPLLKVCHIGDFFKYTPLPLWHRDPIVGTPDPRRFQ